MKQSDFNQRCLRIYVESKALESIYHFLEIPKGFKPVVIKTLRLYKKLTIKTNLGNKLKKREGVKNVQNYFFLYCSKLSQQLQTKHTIFQNFSYSLVPVRNKLLKTNKISRFDKQKIQKYLQIMSDYVRFYILLILLLRETGQDFKQPKQEIYSNLF